ncbi:MAG TPA: adenylate/guanylate cyclase domain-containing protein [Spirochaetia bacterium]|nr:adenylate/guanylate cyclase domain-containing protein [Spirochaetia bacterium]
MADSIERVLGKKINGTRVVPLMLKIVTIFTIFLLVSNFATNYINLMLNRGELLKLANRLLVKDLKELYTFGLNQYEIFQYNKDEKSAIKNIDQSALVQLNGKKSVALGIKPDGSLFFEASHFPPLTTFADTKALQSMIAEKSAGNPDGTIRFSFAGGDYFGVYKYSDQWGAYFVRADELTEFNAVSNTIFRNVSLIIIGMSLIFVIIGVFLMSYILRYVKVITSAIMAMQGDQRIELLDMKGAPNDDITYLGVAFNSLASTIDNLMNIFKKFVARDLAAKAYREKQIRLEGSRRDLAILFTDIKSFTYMTEMLGNDIIRLLNMHYSDAIRHIHDQNGDVGSIIGDALLAIFGVMDNDGTRKSYQAIQAAYQIQDVAASLRQQMHQRREEIVRLRGSLNEAEERVYRAVLLEVGVGIDGGEVFYGTIGSQERMTNTVIGDNVNSASRLEGLTRIYKVPVIVSDYIRNEVDGNYNSYVFQEIDTVQVKGKTVGRKIYWPLPRKNVTEDLERDLKSFTTGLAAYYEGDWKSASGYFESCALPVAEVFAYRTHDATCPKDWNGIWTMKEK